MAAGAVLFFHVGMATGTALQYDVAAALLARGDIGVPLFFALSGLLLYRPWATAALSDRPGPPVRRYLLRRALRILPAYWIVVAVALPIWSRDHVADLWTWAKLLFLAQIYDPSPWWTSSGPTGLVQMWSLAVEAAFYLSLPLLAVALHWYARRATGTAARARRLLAGIVGLAGVSFLWTVFIFHPSYRGYLYLWPPRCWVYLAVGMAVAVLVAWARRERTGLRIARRVSTGWAGCWALAGVLYAVAATPLTGPRLLPFDGLDTALAEQVLYAAVTGLLLAPVALAPARPTPATRLLGNRVLSYLGRISYGIFLWQFVIIEVWYYVTGQQNWTGHFWGNLAGIGLLTVVCGALSYHLVEAPILRLARRTSSADQPADRMVGAAGFEPATPRL